MADYQVGEVMIKLLFLSLLVSFSVLAENGWHDLGSNQIANQEGIKLAQAFPSNNSEDEDSDNLNEEAARKALQKNVFYRWKVDCKLNDATAGKHCTMKKFFAKNCAELCVVAVEMDSKSGLGIQFTYPDQPSVTGKVKLGKNKPESFNEFVIRGELADKLLKQLQTEQYGTVQIHKWHKSPFKFNVNLKGFSVAYGELLKQYNR